MQHLFEGKAYLRTVLIWVNTIYSFSTICTWNEMFGKIICTIQNLNFRIAQIIFPNISFPVHWNPWRKEFVRQFSHQEFRKCPWTKTTTGKTSQSTSCTGKWLLYMIVWYDSCSSAVFFLNKSIHMWKGPHNSGAFLQLHVDSYMDIAYSQI